MSAATSPIRPTADLSPAAVPGLHVTHSGHRKERALNLLKLKQSFVCVSTD